jgi:hypothetical protein
MIKLVGPMSVFGGPDDRGVSASEGLALVPTYAAKPEVFLNHQPPGTTGLARRLDTSKHYIACRWDYHATTPAWLHQHVVRVSNRKGVTIDCIPVDWGPNARTGRIADMSPGAAHALGLQTNDTVEVDIPMPGDLPEPKEHGLQVDTPPVTVTPAGFVKPVWPLQRDCTAFYGDPRKQGWLHANTVEVSCPWPLVLDGAPVSHILIHKKCADSLTRVLNAIWDGVGKSMDKIKTLHYEHSARRARSFRSLSDQHPGYRLCSIA